MGLEEQLCVCCMMGPLSCLVCLLAACPSVVLRGSLFDTNAFVLPSHVT